MAVQLATLPWTPITDVGHRYMVWRFFSVPLSRLRGGTLVR